MTRRAEQRDIVRPRRRHRLLWTGGLLLAAVVIAYFSGGITKLLHLRVAHQLKQRDYEAAGDTLDWVRNLRCANAETAFWDARLKRKLLRITEVPPLLSEAAQRGFDRERLRREALLLQAQTGRITPIIRELDELVSDPRDDGSEICEAYVNGALIAGETQLALTILPVWKAEFPRDPHPHYAHGRWLEYQSKFDDAEGELRAAVELDSRHWPAQYALGRLLLERSRIEEALTHFDAAVPMRDNAAPLFQRAKCLRALSRLDEAHAILKDLVARPADDVRRSFTRVGEPQRGLPIQQELGTLESALRNDAEALRWLDMVLADDPKNLDARYARAMALRGLGRTDEADREFADVKRIRALLSEVDKLADEVQKHPGEPMVAERCRIGELFIQNENGRRGEFWLRDALNHDPHYAPAHALLADYYAALAKRDPAYAPLAEEHRNAAGSRE